MISGVILCQNIQFLISDVIWCHFVVIFLKISIWLLIIDLQTTTIPPFVMFFNVNIWYLGLFYVKIVDFLFLTLSLTSFFVIFLKISIKLLIIDLKTTTIPSFVMFFNENIWCLGLFHVKIVCLSFLTSYDVIIDDIFCHLS